MFRDKDISPLEYEIMEEKVTSMFRATSKMEASVEALQKLDQELASTPSPPRAKVELRSRLLDEAAEAVWYFVVQRELLGLANPDSVFEQYGIPDEVRRCIGIRRKPST